MLISRKRAVPIFRLSGVEIQEDQLYFKSSAEMIALFKEYLKRFNRRKKLRRSATSNRIKEKLHAGISYPPESAVRIRMSILNGWYGKKF